MYGGIAESGLGLAQNVVGQMTNDSDYANKGTMHLVSGAVKAISAKGVQKLANKKIAINEAKQLIKNELKKQSEAVDVGNGKGPVIIGETMKRVEQVAKNYPDAKILNDMPEYLDMGLEDYEVTSKMMEYNRKWILDQFRSGRQIIDIGQDVGRKIPSIFYDMEQNMVNNYQKLYPEWNVLTKLP